MGIFDQNDEDQSDRNGNYGRRQTDRPSGAGGFSGRLIVALLIALFGLFMYMHNTQVNPVTGEKQHLTITPDQEIRLGLESAPMMSQEMGGEVPASDPRSIEVKRIGNMIVAQTEAKKSPWQFQFHLLSDDETVNAFALPGGQIFITLGLYDKLKTEAQLAGVLSHEMGHVIERHTAQQMAKSDFGKMLVMAVATGAANDQGGDVSYGAAAVASLVNNMFQLHYGRNDESQADTWGVKLMSEIGYDPRAMIEVMQILKAAGGGRGHTIEMFQTHPDPDHRIEQIKDYLKTHPVSPDVQEGGNLKEVVRKY